MLSKLAVYFIRGYQMSVRTIWPPCCRFTPSCSEYALQAIVKYGFFKGAIKAGKRLLSCQPFSEKSGFDPLT